MGIKSAKANSNKRNLSYNIVIVMGNKCLMLRHWHQTDVMVDVIVDAKHVTESPRDRRIVYNFKWRFCSAPFLSLALDPYL